MEKVVEFNRKYAEQYAVISNERDPLPEAGEGGGETGKLSRELHRMRELGPHPLGLLLAVERRATQLAQITAKLGPRGSLDNLGRGEKAQLGIFWKEERDIRSQIARWPKRKLERLIPRLIALHRNLLANSQSAETMLAQELAEIARFAARR